MKTEGEKIKKEEKSSASMVDVSNTVDVEARKNDIEIKHKFRAVMFDDEDSFGIIKAILNSSKKN